MTIEREIVREGDDDGVVILSLVRHVYERQKVGQETRRTKVHPKQGLGKRTGQPVDGDEEGLGIGKGGGGVVPAHPPHIRVFIGLQLEIPEVPMLGERVLKEAVAVCKRPDVVVDEIGVPFDEGVGVGRVEKGGGVRHGTLRGGCEGR